ncbi:MAG: hypothetical protein IJ716_08295 [Lachnospiraceae bacterium]|nr:hypothetical protein [Lachnospiraceae bacterium]MBR1852682.1 hypothetical protein [Lachnospiraceae bacterium]
MRPSQTVETYPDGIVDVYADAKRTIGALKVSLRYEKQTIGVRRYYQAQTSVASNRIDRVIKVPHTNKVDRMDIAVMRTEDNRQYRILRIQEKPERGVDLWELQAVQVEIRSGS